MTKYLISFTSHAMEVADDEWELVGRETHAVAQQAKDAGVWVFGGGIDESVAPVRVAGDGTVSWRRAPRRTSGSPAGSPSSRTHHTTLHCGLSGARFRRLLPVPAGSVGVHVQPGVVSRPVAGHRVHRGGNVSATRCPNRAPGPPGPPRCIRVIACQWRHPRSPRSGHDLSGGSRQITGTGVRTRIAPRCGGGDRQFGRSGALFGVNFRPKVGASS